MAPVALGVALIVCVGSVSPRIGAQAAPSGAPVADGSVHELRRRGVQLLYDLDYPEALATFQEAIDRDPANPALHRLAASVIWMGILFEWGAVLADDYLGDAKDEIARPAPSPVAQRSFHDHITRSIELSERYLRDHDREADAHYQLGASLGFQASYTMTIEGRLLGSLGSVRRAFSEHERVLELSPTRKDAGLLPWMYRYSISTMSFPLRLAARLAGIGADRERGLRMVEEAAAYPGEAQPDALFILVALYNREARYDDAFRVIRDLQRRYPKNRLLWLESGTTALRAGRARAASEELEHGLAMLAADARPRAYGEEARWRLSHGTALVPLDRDEAARDLRAALAAAGPDWVRGRAHTALGKIEDLEGRRAGAIEEYRVAVRLCRGGNDRLCADEASRLIRTPYR